MSETNKNKIVLKDRTLELDHNEVAELIHDLVTKSKSEKFSVSLKDFVGNPNEICEITGKKGAIKFISCFSKKERDVKNYTLKPSVMLRLLSHNLMPSEYRRIQFTHGNEYLIHDDFYTEDGISFQPVTFRYFEKGEYKNFNRDELKLALKTEMLNQVDNYRFEHRLFNNHEKDFAEMKGIEITLQEVINHTYNDKKGWWNHLHNIHYNICNELISGKSVEDISNELVSNMKFNDKIIKEKEIIR